MKQFRLHLLILSWLLALPVCVAAQDGWLQAPTNSSIGRPDVMFEGQGQKLQKSAAEWAEAYLSTVGKDGSYLKLKNYRESVTGIHLTYKQMYQGLPVYQSQVKVNISKAGKLRSLFHKTVDPSTIHTNTRQFKHQPTFLKNFSQKGKLYTKKVIFKDRHEPQLAYAVNIIDKASGIHDQYVFDPDGDTLHQRDMNRYLGLTKDTTAVAYVYFPDPLITSENPYGKPFWDNGDKTNLFLKGQREKVQITVNRASPDSFTLKSPFFSITHFSPPKTPVTYSDDTEFNFTRDSSAFEDVNAFYHLQRFNQYMAEIGLGSMFDYQLPVDAHALSNQDNSRFSLTRNTKKGRLYFGEGGVDDAEDADIIIHEFGHALSAYASPGSYGGARESQALEEGLCDYLACSYSRHLDNYNWERLFSWDAGVKPRQKNKFWPGRWCTTDKQYPEDLIGGKYADGEIWAGTFMEVWEKLGRETTDELVLAALNSFSRNMTMNDGARLVLQADSVLYNGEHHSTLLNVLGSRGLVNPQNLGVEGQSKPSQGWNPEAYYRNQAFIVELEKPVQQLSITLQSLSGKVITQKIKGAQDQYQINASGLASGMYILHLQKPEHAKAIKVMKP
jgi:hypothetical protein